ncbi:cytochrome c biogenesis CcdA family protein [Actinomadura livida]|uniref:Cytochrome c biogenesis CcdA family protein n=1 Tax=Actinomadura livida TaxID=79909 RepID=A0A7W7IHE3_9ACTN|nr:MULTISPECIES: cytochrome c biogenesis CcdA family protein [Actinomadura]MBB4777045.1 cytochrome c biogenesis protein CcdA [Actinomadura catellatispora]GGU36916.1 cytochrome C biogenesis protein CcdA [Actinomadura livida]
MERISLALAAGLVAAFNPCGFALLPSYLALLVATPGAGGVWRALRLSAAMTAGFVTVFGAFGLLISVLTTSVQEYLPWLTIVIGLALAVLGGWLLTGRELLVRLPRVQAGGLTGSLAGLYGYGVSYAVASLSCTIAPFLAVTGLVSGGTGIAAGLAAFAAYGIGMGLVVGLLSMLVALAREAAVARTRRILPHVSRVSGAFLLPAGLYVTYYGWYETRLNAGASADSTVVDTATEVQGALTTWLDQLGVWWIAAVFTALVAATLAAHRLRRHRTASGKDAARR